jgi:hypothetical protein
VFPSTLYFGGIRGWRIPAGPMKSHDKIIRRCCEGAHKFVDWRRRQANFRQGLNISSRQSTNRHLPLPAASP